MRLSYTAMGIVLIFFSFSGPALAADIISGRIASIFPCYDAGGRYAFTTSASSTTFILRSGVPSSTVGPLRAGQGVFAIVGTSTVGCVTDYRHPDLSRITGRAVSYFSSGTALIPSSPSSGTTGTGGGVSNALQSLINNLLQQGGSSSLSSLLGGGNPAGASGGGAGAGGGGLSYGGSVTASIPCPCSGNVLITVNGSGGPRQFLYQLGAPQFREYSLPRPGIWTLFNYAPGGVCLVPAGTGCAPLGLPQGTITPTVGTSLTL